MYMELDMTAQDVVAVADANDSARLDRIGQATESKIANQSIVLQET